MREFKENQNLNQLIEKQKTDRNSASTKTTSLHANGSQTSRPSSNI